MTNTKEQELILSLENTTEPIRRYLEKQEAKRLKDDLKSYKRTSAIDKVTESKGE